MPGVVLAAGGSGAEVMLAWRRLTGVRVRGAAGARSPVKSPADPPLLSLALLPSGSYQAALHASAPSAGVRPAGLPRTESGGRGEPPGASRRRPAALPASGPAPRSSGV